VGKKNHYICILCWKHQVNTGGHICHLVDEHTPDELMLIGYNWKILSTHNNGNKFDRLKKDILTCFNAVGE
jgi:hypothetical protein